MNFATLKGLTIPEGVVTEIKDASGRVLWKLQSGAEMPAVFEVAKQTATTYAGETKYENEEFILFDIYPKKGGTVKVTYGGLTKTVKDTSGAEEPNAIQVFFGTFNGVSDEVATPASGTLTIDGAYRGFGLGSFGAYSGKNSGTYAPCITNVIDIGSPVYIGAYTFQKCTGLTSIVIPDGVTTIGNYTFDGCTNLASVVLADSLTSIGIRAFQDCTSLTNIVIPDGVTSIGDYTFNNCTSLTNIELPSGITSIGSYAFYECNNLTSMIIPEGVTSIGNSAFYGCGLMANTTIPASVTSIGNSAFSVNPLSHDITDRTIVIHAQTPATLGGSSVFDINNSVHKTTLIVPVGCGEVYKTAEKWSEYADNIVEASSI